jgi:hypothetical protein
MVFSPDMLRRIQHTIVALQALPDTHVPEPFRPTGWDDGTDDFSVNRRTLKRVWTVEASKDATAVHQVQQTVARELLLSDLLPACEGLWTVT